MSENINIMDQISYFQEKNVNDPNGVLGRGLCIPYNIANSSSRKLMYSLHTEQMMPLMNPEVPLVSTGYENEYGVNSSSFICAQNDLRVLAKFSKFPMYPDLIYYLIVQDVVTQEITFIERVGYKHNTESFGYLINSNSIDKKQPGEFIHRGDVLMKSLAFDEFNNRQDGVNMNVAFINESKTTEDGIKISDVAAKKFDSPLIKKVSIVINDNDIPLNLYGDYDRYKSIPDIGEEIKNGILCALRREKKDEAFFNQTIQRLRETMISDEKFTISEGKVIDINIYCNNPEGMADSMYTEQLDYYYKISQQFAWNIVDYLKKYVDDPNYKCSYELLQMYNEMDKRVKGFQWMKDGKIFSFCVIELVVLEICHLNEGDKITNRYGGKGVIAKVVPQHEMPRLDNGEYVDIILNPASVCNRLNAGQLNEMSTTFAGKRFLDGLRNGIIPPEEELDLYLKYLYYMAPKHYEYMEAKLRELDSTELAMFLDTFNDCKGINVCVEPVTENLTLDTLRNFYNDFEWIKPYKVTVPIKNSDGTYRYIPTRRDLYVGVMYMIRLKQYAEEKFSAVSLAATNLRGENTRSKASKTFKATHSKTPVSLGNMEITSLLHIGCEHVIEALMLYSASPIGRRLSEQILTGDPFNINITLNDDAKNRGVEILNTYLKTMGLRLRFKRTKIEMEDPVEIHPVIAHKNTDAVTDLEQPVTVYTEAEKMLRAMGINPYEYDVVEDDGMEDAVMINPVKVHKISNNTVKTEE